MKLQNLIFSLCTVLFISTTICAQNLCIGAIGGVNIASISTDLEDVKSKNLTAFGIGGVVDWKLRGNLALCFEPMYLQKGAKLEFPIVEIGGVVETIFGEMEGEFNYSYIEIPMFLKYSLSSSNIKPYLMAGSTIGILTSAKMVGIDRIKEYSSRLDIKDESQSIDYGVGFGAGVAIPVGRNTLFVEGRYVLGLTDAYKGPGELENEVDLLLEGARFTHTGIHIMAGLSLPWGE